MANHTGVLLGTVQKWANGQPDVYIISEEGHKIYTQKLLITFYSHTLNSILNGGFDNEIQGVTIPASSSSIVNLLKVLATGIAITKNKLDLTDVSKTAEAMGISMENWQIGVKNNRAKPSGGQAANQPTNGKNAKQVKKKVNNVAADVSMKEELDKDSSQEKTDKKYSCPDCGKLFGRKDHLNRHALTHSGVSYPCNICGSSFKRKDALSNHMSKVHDTDYVEDSDPVVHVKQEQFISEDGINDTEIVNQQSLYNDKFENGQVANDEGLITNDMTGVDNESTNQEGDVQMSDGYNANIEVNAASSFPCGQCDKVFKSRTHLSRHEAVHSGIRLSCDKCSSTFSRKDKLNAHVRKKHSQTDDEKLNSQDNVFDPINDVETDEASVAIEESAASELKADEDEEVNSMKSQV